MRMTGNTAQNQAPPRCHHPVAHGLDPTPSINGHWIFLRCGVQVQGGLCEARYRVATSVWEAEALRRQENATLRKPRAPRESWWRRGVG